MKTAKSREALAEIISAGISPEVVKDLLLPEGKSVEELELDGSIEALLLAEVKKREESLLRVTKFLYDEAGVEFPRIDFTTVGRYYVFSSYPLIDGKQREMNIICPVSVRPEGKEQIPTPKNLRLKDLFNFTDLADEFLERELPPGAYALVGKPASGKSALARAAFRSLARAGFTCLFTPVMEPLPWEMRALGCQSFVTDDEIKTGLNQSLQSSADIIFIDSLRFLAAVSRYPARSGGIPGGLELYGTVFDEIAARLGKRLFLVMTTSDARDITNEAYITLMQGAVQGVIIPDSLTLQDIGTMTGSGEITLRGADRTRVRFSAELDSPVTMAVSKETVDKIRSASSNERIIDKITRKV